MRPSKAIPDAKFVTTEENGLNISYDPGQAYDVYRTFLSANPDVQFIQNVDIGAEHADRAIKSLNKAGQGLHHRLERLQRASSTGSRRGSRSPTSTSAGPIRRPSAARPAPSS